jgi:hypothetical protein
LIVVLEIWCDIKAGQLKKARSTSTKVAGVGELQECNHEEWMPLARYKALRTDKVAFFHFCSNYLSVTVGKAKVYNKMKCKVVLTKWATPSDKAFTLLLLENNWQLWLEQAKVLFESQMEMVSKGDDPTSADPECLHPTDDNATIEEKQRKSKGKPVRDKRSKYASNMNNDHKLQGWSEAGKQRLNKLMVEV